MVGYSLTIGRNYYHCMRTTDILCLQPKYQHELQFILEKMVKKMMRENGRNQEEMHNFGNDDNYLSPVSRYLTI